MFILCHYPNYMKRIQIHRVMQRKHLCKFCLLFWITWSKRLFRFNIYWRTLQPAFFWKVKIAPCLFWEIKNASCPFSEMKNKAYPFPTISRARMLDSCRKSLNATWKVCSRANSCTQKQQILHLNAILFLLGETFYKRGE